MNLSTIFLYGSSGSGKSTLGGLIASSLGLPFYDLDTEIERHQGKPIPDIFAAEGEAGFRVYERDELRRLIGSVEGVVALGGGALVDAENRAIVQECGPVLLLSAPVEILLNRLQGDSLPRPLLQGDANNSLKVLLERRADHYDSFPLKLDTAQLTPDQAAMEAQVCLGMFRVKGMGDARCEGYDVRVRRGGMDSLGQLLLQRGLRAPVVLISDENVAPLYAGQVLQMLQTQGLLPHLYEIPAGEKYKTAASLQSIWDAFVSFGLERGGTVVALGGGVVSDLAGFASATYMRGINWVALPTTMLAMVDASLGGKTGADLPQGKNLIGAFHPPAVVLADPEVLMTLPDEELRSGMAEVVKHGIIGDSQLFELCEAVDGLETIRRNPAMLDEIIRRAIAVKIRIIEEDPYEQGRRAALNLGHTIAHALEVATGFTLRHGEAVAIGLVAEARLAERTKLAETGLADRIAAVLDKLGLPAAIPQQLDMDTAFDAMAHDKKRSGGKVRFALPVKVGDVRTGVEIENLRRDYASYLGFTRA